MGKGRSLAIGLAVLGAAGYAITQTVKPKTKVNPIQCRFQCHCGKVKGRIDCERGDLLRTKCYCESCRLYSGWIENEAAKKAVGGVKRHFFDHGDGGVEILLLCKSDLFIDEGLDQLRLAKMTPDTYTLRFFANCCNTPMLATVQLAGMIFLQERTLRNVNPDKKFGEPLLYFPEDANPPLRIDYSNRKVGLGNLVSVILRFAPYLNAGPKLNYEDDPVLVRRLLKGQ